MFFNFINYSLSTLLLLASCAIQQPEKSTGFLEGNAGALEGNCMPGPGREPCKAKPISTTILISSLTKDFAEELLVEQTRSDSEGKFQIELPVGSYSLFVMDDNQVVCTITQCPDACFCNPFKISSDSTTIVDATINHASW